MSVGVVFTDGSEHYIHLNHNYHGGFWGLPLLTLQLRAVKDIKMPTS